MTTQAIVEVNEAVEALRRAMIGSGDRGVVDRLTDEEMSWSHTSGRTQNKKEVLDDVSSGKALFADIKLSNQIVTVIENVCVVRHVFKATRPGEAPDDRDLGILSVWMKRGGGWKVVARQSVVMAKK